jgi:hypothetical protein
VHGVQQLTLVCQHILDGLNAKKRVGFFWTFEDPQNRDQTLTVQTAKDGPEQLAENGSARR